MRCGDEGLCTTDQRCRVSSAYVARLRTAREEAICKEIPVIQECKQDSLSSLTYYTSYTCGNMENNAHDGA